MTEDEDEDDPHEQRGHGGVAAMCIPLGDGVVVRMRLHEKANSCFCPQNLLAFKFMVFE